MISEEKPLSNVSRNKEQPMQEGSLIPNIKYNSNAFNTVKNNFDPKNTTDQSQMESYRDKTFYNGRKKSDIHPLDFYTLGKIPPNTVYPNLEWNKGIKSTSNDIIYRNALSINTKKYNKIDLHKRITNLYEQNITENNYLEPIKIYKTYEKYKYTTKHKNKSLFRKVPKIPIINRYYKWSKI